MRKLIPPNPKANITIPNPDPNPRVSLTLTLTMKQEKGEPVEYLCLVEVWHTAGGNEIRQAEGPRPRTIPGPEAWYWLDRWCSREGVDLSTWDCYS